MYISVTRTPDRGPVLDWMIVAPETTPAILHLTTKSGLNVVRYDEETVTVGVKVFSGSLFVLVDMSTLVKVVKKPDSVDMFSVLMSIPDVVISLAI